MAIWPFKRRDRVDADVPSEIKEYYDAERRERRGIAWLLGIGTLLVTIALAVLLFFGGRWLFRTIFDNDNGEQVAQNEPAPAPATQTPENNQGDEEIKPEQSPSPTPSPSPEPSPAPTPSPTPTPAPTPPPPSTSKTPKSTKNNGKNIPHTGPRETIAVFVAVTVLATIGHSFYTRKQLAK